MSIIQHLSGREILDSRGRPTVRATCALASGAIAGASVPSGASTGAAEALELRDRDPRRYRGLGCRAAAGNITGELHHALVGRAFETQHALDEALIALDGTPSKSRLGANALLGVSLAFARAVALEQGIPLYQRFAAILDERPPTTDRGSRIEDGRSSRRDPRSSILDPRSSESRSSFVARPSSLPRLTVNLFSGGKHAGGQTPIQDVLVVPVAARTIDEGLAVVYEIYQAAAELVSRKYGMRALTADAGALAPEFASGEAMLSDAAEA